jgi:hypothetical protein
MTLVETKQSPVQTHSQMALQCRQSDCIMRTACNTAWLHCKNMDIGLSDSRTMLQLSASFVSCRLERTRLKERTMLRMHATMLQSALHCDVTQSGPRAGTGAVKIANIECMHNADDSWDTNLSLRNSGLSKVASVLVTSTEHSHKGTSSVAPGSICMIARCLFTGVVFRRITMSERSDTEGKSRL